MRTLTSDGTVRMAERLMEESTITLYNYLKIDQTLVDDVVGTMIAEAIIVRRDAKSEHLDYARAFLGVQRYRQEMGRAE